MVCSRGESLTTHPTMTSKILVQYGSLRSNSVSHKLALEVQRFLTQFGVEAIVADPNLPLYDEELRDEMSDKSFVTSHESFGCDWDLIRTHRLHPHGGEIQPRSSRDLAEI